jgi:Lrp/AsnC family transcriptional regulator
MHFLNEFDRRILRAMQADPAMTISQLAEQVGLSQTPCWRRLKQLEQAGVIARRAVILDARKLGFAVDVFAHIRIGKHDEADLDALEEQVRNHPEIVECFSMSGDSDYVLRIVARSIEDYERFLKKVLLHLPGVASVNSSFALKTVKLTTDLPV